MKIDKNILEFIGKLKENRNFDMITDSDLIRSLVIDRLNENEIRIEELSEKFGISIRVLRSYITNTDSKKVRQTDVRAICLALGIKIKMSVVLDENWTPDFKTELPKFKNFK